jgi:hypothetical protein
MLVSIGMLPLCSGPVVVIAILGLLICSSLFMVSRLGFGSQFRVLVSTVHMVLWSVVSII